MYVNITYIYIYSLFLPMNILCILFVYILTSSLDVEDGDAGMAKAPVMGFHGHVWREGRSIHVHYFTIGAFKNI